MKTKSLLFVVLLLISGNLLAGEGRKCGAAFIGINYTHISSDRAESLQAVRGGSYVLSIIQNTSAEKFGLERGDVVIGINGDRVGNGVTIKTLLEDYRSGDVADLIYVRDGQEKVMKDFVFCLRPISEKALNEPFLGVYSGSGQGLGAGISNTVKNSTADKIGLRGGDIITSINEFTFDSWSDLGSALDNIGIGTPITVTYLRNGKTKTATGTLASRAETYRCPEDVEEARKAYETPEEVVNEAAPEEGPEELTENTDRDVQPLSRTPGTESISQPTQENDIDESLTLYPNPNSGNFNVRFAAENNGTALLRISDVSGKVILNETFEVSAGKNTKKVRLSNIPSGMYVLELVRDGSREVRRISIDLAD